MEINKNTIVDSGLQISKMFRIEHVSTGAYHPMLASIMPKITSILDPSKPNEHFLQNNSLPMWKVARNLQLGAENILDGMLLNLGMDFVLRSGFLNNVTGFNEAGGEFAHLFGSSFDVQIANYQDNMYNVAKDVQQLAQGASKLDLVFGVDSWVHVEFTNNSLRSLEVPEFTTIDTVAGVTEKGLTSIRGFV